MTFEMDVNSIYKFKTTTTLPTIVPHMEFISVWNVEVHKPSSSIYDIYAESIHYGKHQFRLKTPMPWRYVHVTIYSRLFELAKPYILDWNDLDAAAGNDGQSLAGMGVSNTH